MRLPFKGRRPSPAMGVAFLALILAVSGTAVALPGKNTVDSGDLKRGSVKGPDIARGAVTSTKLRNGAVTNPKLRNGAVSTAKLRNDAVTGEKVLESSLGQVPSAANANTVGGFAPNHLTRVASNTSDTGIDAFTSAAFVDQITTSITAPTAGFLVINAASWNEWDIDSGAATFADATFQLAVDGAPVGVNAVHEYQDNTVGSNDSATVPIQAVAQVAAGNHTVALQWQRSDGTAQLFGQERSIQVLFVPFNATGAQP
jgi:hypothetical protein